MKILVACEFSGVVRDAFRERGHEAWSCDLLGPDDLPDVFRNQKWPNYHLEGDVRWFIDRNAPGGGKWDVLIGFPPCTYLCNSGVKWLYGGRGKVRDPVRWAQMEEGAAFFKELLDADIPRICLENPIMHGYAKEIIGRKQSQVIQPWQFGHGETKATCLWLKNLPLLKPADIVDGREQRVFRLPPGKGRSMERSKTFPGIAEAMAEQWG